MVIPRKTSVFIIESPGSEDLLTGRMEGRLLAESLRLDGISQQYYLVTDIGTFRGVVKYIERVMTKQGKTFPIVHISAHGDHDGIAFTNGKTMKWTILADIMVNLNRRCNGKLVLCLSCCDGNYINTALVKTIDQMPFRTAVSAFGSPTWNDAAIAFVVFYHQYINKAVKISQAVAIMNDASATGACFMLDYARITQRSLVNYLHKEFRKKSTTNSTSLHT
jgi:hypothetical protein